MEYVSECIQRRKDYECHYIEDVIQGTECIEKLCLDPNRLSSFYRANAREAIRSSRPDCPLEIMILIEEFSCDWGRGVHRKMAQVALRMDRRWVNRAAFTDRVDPIEWKYRIRVPGYFNQERLDEISDCFQRGEPTIIFFASQIGNLLMPRIQEAHENYMRIQELMKGNPYFTEKTIADTIISLGYIVNFSHEDHLG